MGGTKPNKDRKKKVENFKAEQKQQAAKSQIPRTHLVPVPTWQSDANLDFRGDLFQALEQQLYAALENIQRMGQVLGMAMQQNIKNEKVKIDYVWNNGEKPTEEEVTAFKQKMDEVENERKKQMEEMEANMKKVANHAKTGLVGPNGQPVATTQDLGDDEPDEAKEPSEVITDDIKEEAQ